MSLTNPVSDNGSKKTLEMGVLFVEIRRWNMSTQRPNSGNKLLVD
jgi:hypothetical protein